jgi:hypothetical protein
MAAKKSHDDALLDTDNVDTLKAHQEDAKKHVEDAVAAYEVVAKRAEDTTKVHDVHVLTTMASF